jgi:hypothetical protein
LRRIATRVSRYFDVPSRQVAGAAIVLSLGIIAHFGLSQSEAHEEALEHAVRDTRSASRVLAEHAARSFDAAEETLRGVARLRADSVRGIYRTQASIYFHLATLRGGSTMLREIGWYDQYGDRVASSESPNPPRTSVADADFFRAVRYDGARGLHVSAPQLVTSNGWQITVALRLENLDGSFAGVAVGTVDPEYFARVYRTVDF